MPDVTLTASDGHCLSAFRLDPEGTPRGALVVIQEIFGVNDHIRALVAMYAGFGYATIAPAIFDRRQRDVRSDYSAEEQEAGIAIARSLDFEAVLLDLAAAVEAVAPAGKVAAIGYCLGGVMAWRCAARVPGVSAAVSYYGAQIPMFVAERPRVPIQFHLARRDEYWPVQAAREICDAVETGQVHEYDADHGFACDHRAAVFEPHASALALERTLAFLQATIG